MRIFPMIVSADNRTTCEQLPSNLPTLSLDDHENEMIVHSSFLSPMKDDFDCHTSSIVEMSKSHYCAVWKGGPGKGLSNIDMKENVGIWLSLFDGKNWSEPKEIVSAPQSVCWNPVLTFLPNGELLLFYRLGSSPRTALSFLKKSQDNGLHWSKEELLPAGIVGPTKNKPIVTPEGTLICPSSVSVGEPKDEHKSTACWIEILESKDGKARWKKIGPLELPHRKFGVTEPALIIDQNGHLRMFCRDRANKIGEKGLVWMAISKNNGLDWSEFIPTPLPNPDSGIDVVDLKDGRIVLFYNHSHTDRHPLHMAQSFDGGDNWSSPIVLDEEGEFPSAILASDGMIHVTYPRSSTYGQRKIAYKVIDPKKL